MISGRTSRAGLGLLRLLVGALTAAAMFVAMPAAQAAITQMSETPDSIAMTGPAGYVTAIHVAGDRVYIGGTFDGIRSTASGATKPPAYVAAFDATTGARIASFQPQVDGEVRAITTSTNGSIVYLGGTFATVNGLLQRKVGAVFATDGTSVQAFTPKVIGGSVFDLATAPDGDIFVGGRFEEIDGNPRKHVARLSPSGKLRSWSPVLNGNNSRNRGTAFTLFIDSPRNRLLVGGEFLDVGGQPNTARLVAFDLDSGNLLSSLPVHPTSRVNDVDVASGKLFVAMGGAGGKAAIYDLASGEQLRLYPTDGDVVSVEVAGGIAYFGGHWMNKFGSQASARLHAVRVVDGNHYTPFKPTIDASVRAIQAVGNRLWIGGEFSQVEGQTRYGVARFSPADGLIDVDPPSPPPNLRQTGATYRSVLIRWDAAGDDTAIAKYHIYRGSKKIATTPLLRYTDGNLEIDTAYQYRVKAEDTSGNISKFSATLTARTNADTTPPTVPSDLDVTNSWPHWIALDWTKSTDPSGIDNYRVLRDGVVVGTPGGSSYTDKGLRENTVYSYRVQAVDVFGNVSAASNVVAQTTALVAVGPGASWRYKDDGSNQGTAWRARSFDQKSWVRGGAELGYGDGDERTVISGGPVNDRHITTYFRKLFKIDKAGDFSVVRVKLRRDDGAVVYLNGVEIARDNMPAGTITSETTAVAIIGGSDERAWQRFVVPASALVNGWNSIAVEIHQQAPTSSDVSFALALILVS